MPTAHASQFDTQWELGLETAYGTPLTPASSYKALPCTEDPKNDAVKPNPYSVPVIGGGTSEPLAENNGIGTFSSSARATCRPTDIRMKTIWSSFYQKNSGFASTPFTDTFAPYTSNPTTFRGYTIHKGFLPSSSGGTFEIAGSLCRRWKLSSQVDGPLLLEHEWQGLGGQMVNVARTATTLAGTGLYMHQDTVLTIGGAAIHCSKQEIEAKNSAGAFYGTSQVPTGVVLGPITLAGSFTVSAREHGPTLLSALAAATYQAYSLKYGTAGTAGYYEVVGDILLLDVDQEAENGIELLTFKFGMGKSTTAHVCSATTVAAFS